MKYIRRDTSVITGKKHLEHLYTFKNFPVFMGCVDDLDDKKDLRLDMSFSICNDSGVIQLDKLIPLDILYQSQHVDGVGPTWQKYYQDFVEYLERQNPRNILEIGGGKGVLAEFYLKRNKDSSWTIIEPNPLYEGKERVKIIKSFFDEKFLVKETYNTVVFSQVLEHIYDPKSFLQTIYDFLAVGDKLIFAHPNLEHMLRSKFTNAINFEHTVFLTDYFVDYLLLDTGYRIIDKSFYGNHSIFYTVEKSRTPLPVVRFDNKNNIYKKIFFSFLDYYRDLINGLNEKIDNYSGDVFLFGAHIFSQYLLGFGLHVGNITAILDNSPLKQNRRLYGTPFVVYPPEVIQGKANVAVILKTGVYQEEIKKQLRELNKNVLILE